MKQDLLDLIKKIEYLKKIDKNFQIFGSNHHKYILNAKLSEKKVEEFEQSNGIALPSDYRMFLTNIGDGGCGPYYGLLPLRYYHQHYDNHIWEEDDLSKSYLRFSFPFIDKWIPETGLNESESYKINKESISGTLALSHEGCGYYTILIVKGIEEGNIWLDGMVTDQGMMPLIRNEKKIGFYDWYEEWLDKSLIEVSENNKNRSIFGLITQLSQSQN